MPAKITIEITNRQIEQIIHYLLSPRPIAIPSEMLGGMRTLLANPAEVAESEVKKKIIGFTPDEPEPISIEIKETKPQTKTKKKAKD